MNYRHAFHAGNFADVLKHAVLAYAIEHLKRKDGAFRVVDTHAGIGRYDLTADEATRTGEWRSGIARFLGPEKAAPEPALAAFMKPYLEAVAGLNEGGALHVYPGSPCLARVLMRRQDRLSACELHEADAETLKQHFAGDWQARIVALDGWLALRAFLPPKERRGLVLIDPPFESRDEFGRLADGFAEALKRWPSGTYILWYPIKDRQAVEGFIGLVARLPAPNMLRIELSVGVDGTGGLGACGLLVANPPWTLEAAMRDAGPSLARHLGGEKGRFHLTRLVADGAPAIP